MTKRKNILVVSLVAMLAAGAARAENASVTYVNNQDQKLADRIVTQDGRIKKLNDWVNPLKDGSRATLATEAQDAYRAINELKEAVDAIDIPTQVNADWNEADTTNPAYIQNKPEDLVNQDALDTALAGKMNKMTVDSEPILDSPNLVTSGGVKAAIEAAQLDGEVDLSGYASKTYVDEKVAAVPAQVSSDWNATEGVTQILNKPTIPTDADIVSPSELQTALADKQDKIDEENKLPAANVDGLAPVATSGDYADLTNTPTIPEQVQSDWDVTDEASPAFIAHKPTIPTDTDIVSPSELETALADKQDKIDEENKLPAANVDGLAPVATSGDYADLTNTPTIPAQVQSDWDVTDETSPAFIAHKPTIPNVEGLVDSETLTGALAGKQDTIDEEHKLPATNVDGLAPVATSGDYADLTNTPTIPTQVNSDWNATEGVAQILNKPEIYTKSEVDDKVANVVAGDMSEALEGYVKKTDVESSLSSSSTNPVQNLVVTGALDEKVPLGNVPDSGEYVLGFVDGIQTYIPVVDAQGNSGPAVVAIANEPGGGE